MAINYLESFPYFNLSGASTLGGFLESRAAVKGIYIPDTVPFSKPAILARAAFAYTCSDFFNLTFNYFAYLKLYSLTGSTLTLVNSASGLLTSTFSSSASRNSTYNWGTFWLTMVTSATSNLTQGNSWLLHYVSISGTQRIGTDTGTSAINCSASVFIAPKNGYSVIISQNGLPVNGSIFSSAAGASIATSDIVKDGSYLFNNIFILIA